MCAPKSSICEGPGCRARADPAKAQHGEHRAAVCTLGCWGVPPGQEEQDEAQTPAESCECCGIIKSGLQQIPLHRPHSYTCPKLIPKQIKEVDRPLIHKGGEQTWRHRARTAPSAARQRGQSPPNSTDPEMLHSPAPRRAARNASSSRKGTPQKHSFQPTPFTKAPVPRTVREKQPEKFDYLCTFAPSPSPRCCSCSRAPRVVLAPSPPSPATLDAGEPGAINNAAGSAPARGHRLPRSSAARQPLPLGWD